MNFIENLRGLLVALWLGAATFFSFAVAPNAFAVLPERELAGLVVNRTLSIINYAGLLIGIIVLILPFLSRAMFSNVNTAKIWIERLLLVIIAAACAIGQFVIAARLQTLRQEMGRPIDTVAIDNPLRVAFNDLHGYSVIILTVAMISAMIVFFLIASNKKTDLENR